MSNQPSSYWLLIPAFLIASLIVGSALLAVKQITHKSVEITVSPAVAYQSKGEVYVGGSVANPGFYPLREGDTINAILEAAGVMPNADLTRLELHVPRSGESHPPQKVNINRAEPWLLTALPGIGPGKAQAIVNYRNQHGHFHNVQDLLKVEGIGSSTLEKIKDLITVED
ncbi:MAG TPA: ComEA family DNA-binding protein [Dehalococcoidia bacterium]|nr:ComEA family DNA-binding protein [Dehalococcoidia bacterium]